MCDEFTRERIGGTVARSITADDVVVMLETALLVRGAPGFFIRCDNGPEFIAAAIGNWWRINRIETTYIVRTKVVVFGDAAGTARNDRTPSVGPPSMRVPVG